MRLAVGLTVLGVAVVALGALGQVRYAPYVQMILQEDAAQIASGSRHGVSAEVQGRDIRVSGLVDGPAEHERLLTAFAAVRGHRVIVDETEVLPLVSPFEVAASWLDGRLSVTGHAPTAFGAQVWADLGAGEVPLAAGAPDEQFTEAVARGLAALQSMEEGTLAVADRRMSIAGIARTPVEGEVIRGLLDQLPQGYQADLGMEFFDDGAPPVYGLHYHAETGTYVDGKLPVGLTVTHLIEALGLAEADNLAAQALLGEDTAVPEAVLALRGWMSEVESLDLSVSPEDIVVRAGVGAGADLELVQRAIQADLGPLASVEVLLIAPTADDGTVRDNVVTGRSEILRNGYWLPRLDFFPNPETCAQWMDDAVAQARIGFVTGSARLDARARDAVNRWAAIVGPCVTEAGLQGEIGGHTDNMGAAEANLALSLERAEAVRNALIARGVSAGALRAQGYGDQDPIADNATDEGRAANRRTTLRWIDE